MPWLGQGKGNELNDASLEKLPNREQQLAKV